MVKSVDLRCRFSIVIMLFFSIFVAAQALWLHLPAKGTKCVSEELHNNVVVLGDFIIIGDVHPSRTISLKVTSPFGKTVHHKENVKEGQFAFTTSEAGNYLACFSADHHGTADLNVNLEWRTGIAAKDWESVAKKENIEGLDLELRKLEGAVEAIHEQMNFLMIRELQMRLVSEKTNSRVARFSIMSLGVCIAASIVQIVYLKQYFQKKKMI